MTAKTPVLSHTQCCCNKQLPNSAHAILESWCATGAFMCPSAYHCLPCERRENDSSTPGWTATFSHSGLEDADFMRCIVTVTSLFAESFLSILQWLHSSPVRQVSAGLLFPHNIPAPGNNTAVGVSKRYTASKCQKNGILGSFFFLL